MLKKSRVKPCPSTLCHNHVKAPITIRVTSVVEFLGAVFVCLFVCSLNQTEIFVHKFEWSKGKFDYMRNHRPWGWKKSGISLYFRNTSNQKMTLIKLILLCIQILMLLQENHFQKRLGCVLT